MLTRELFKTLMHSYKFERNNCQPKKLPTLNSLEENVCLVWLGFSSALYFMAFRSVSVEFSEAQI